MEIFAIILVLVAALVSGDVFGETPTNSAVVYFTRGVSYYNPDKPPLDKTNHDGTLGVSWIDGHPDLAIKKEPRTAQFRLVISNSNLFTSAEQTFLKNVWAKYRIPATNAVASFRTDSGDGYDVHFMTGRTWVEHHIDPSYRLGDDYFAKQTLITNHSDWSLDIAEVKHWQLNGLWLNFYGDHGGGCLLHFTNDLAFGDWYDWGPSGNLRFHAKFNKPYSLFEHIDW